MGKCLKCGKNIGLFNKVDLCKKCESFIIVKFLTCKEDFERFNIQISSQYKTPDSYMSRFSKILDLIDEMKECEKLLPKKITVSTSKEDVLTQMEEILIEQHSRILNKCYDAKTQKTISNRLNEYGAQLEICIENYNFLNECLKGNLEEVDMILNKIIDESVEKKNKEKIEKNNNNNSNDPHEEIKKFKELLDMNIISQDEFDQKKKELLNI